MFARRESNRRGWKGVIPMRWYSSKSDSICLYLNDLDKGRHKREHRLVVFTLETRKSTPGEEY